MDSPGDVGIVRRHLAKRLPVLVVGVDSKPRDLAFDPPLHVFETVGGIRRDAGHLRAEEAMLLQAVADSGDADGRVNLAIRDVAEVNGTHPTPYGTRAQCPELRGDERTPERLYSLGPGS
jgi:hypothetical protein